LLPAFGAEMARWLILADDLTGAAALCHRIRAKGTHADGDMR
jgi:hypothetical protein